MINLAKGLSLFAYEFNDVNTKNIIADHHRQLLTLPLKDVLLANWIFNSSKYSNFILMVSIGLF
jgi:hypothetical protein